MKDQQIVAFEAHTPAQRLLQKVYEEDSRAKVINGDEIEVRWAPESNRFWRLVVEGIHGVCLRSGSGEVVSRWGFLDEDKWFDQAWSTLWALIEFTRDLDSPRGSDLKAVQSKPGEKVVVEISDTDAWNLHEYLWGIDLEELMWCRGDVESYAAGVAIDKLRDQLSEVLRNVCGDLIRERLKLVGLIKSGEHSWGASEWSARYTREALELLKGIPVYHEDGSMEWFDEGYDASGGGNAYVVHLRLKVEGKRFQLLDPIGETPEIGEPEEWSGSVSRGYVKEGELVLGNDLMELTEIWKQP